MGFNLRIAWAIYIYISHDIAPSLSWECGMLMALIPNQFKDTDLLYLVTCSLELWYYLVYRCRLE